MAATRNETDSMTDLIRHSIPCIRYLLKPNEQTANYAGGETGALARPPQPMPIVLSAFHSERDSAMFDERASLQFGHCLS
jgi:hypothetical protein